MIKLYVGNLPFSVNDSELREIFSEHGEVHSAQVVMDRESGRSRGFGFVEMDQDNGEAAIKALNGAEVGGRALVVNEARPREERPRGGGGGGFRSRRQGGGGDRGGW